MTVGVTRKSSSPIRFGVALGSWASLIGFLMVREFDKRFQGTRLGPLLALAEPILMIVAIALFRGEIRNIAPPFGTSLVGFLSTGVFPFYVFLRLSTRWRNARYDSSHRLPRVTTTET